MGTEKKDEAVLLCGIDERVLHYRALVLTRAGFDVETALSPAQAGERLERRRFQLAVLCHGLGESSRNALKILCWKARVPVYDVPVLVAAEELVRSVAAKLRGRG